MAYATIRLTSTKGLASEALRFRYGRDTWEGLVSAILETLRKAFGVIRQVNRERATEMLEFELKELENIFTLLVVGGFVGMPSPPAPIAMELLPLLEREMNIMLSRSDFAQDPLGAMIGLLDID